MGGGTRNWISGGRGKGEWTYSVLLLRALYSSLKWKYDLAAEVYWGIIPKFPARRAIFLMPVGFNVGQGCSTGILFLVSVLSLTK